MNIVFMGTTDFAVACLNAMTEGGYPVRAVVTKEDRPKNRGMKMSFSPVKEAALSAGLEILQPLSLRDGELTEQLRDLQPDLFVVVAYGRLLPKALLELPKFGCINVHGSLLPRWRGAAPIQWAVLEGDAETGVSTMYLAEGMDSGDVIESAALPIGPTESFGSVYERLKTLGGELLISTLRKFEQGAPTAKPQDPALVTYAPPITREDTLLDWSREPEYLLNRVRGLDPKPGARGRIGDTEFKFFSPEFSDRTTELPDGSAVGADKNGILIACGGGKTIRFAELQASGGKRMRAADYLRGHRLP